MKKTRPAGMTTIWYEQISAAFSIEDARRVRPIQELVIAKISEPVFCQILGKDISPSRCLMTQFQPECLGCSAPSHFCHACRYRPIAFGAVELCSRCLKSALAIEQRAGKLDLPRDLPVRCQKVSRTISVNTCRNVQDERCRGCGEPSRFCADCHKRPCRYPNEGLCLTCLVQRYGQGFHYRPFADDLDDAVTAQDSSAVPPSAATETGEGPTAQSAPEPEPPVALSPELLAQAIVIVMRRQICHPSTIARNLNMSEELATMVRDQLIAYGVIAVVPRLVDYQVTVSLPVQLDKLALPLEVRQALGLPPTIDQSLNGGERRRRHPGQRGTAEAMLVPTAEFIVLHQNGDPAWLAEQFGIGRRVAERIHHALETLDVLGPKRRGQPARTVLVNSLDELRQRLKTSP